MSCPGYTKFNNVTSLNDNNLINQLENNVKSFLDWGFLNIGGFINVNYPTSGLYNGSYNQLNNTEQPGLNKGQVWQTFKKDWVWETGVYYNGYSPISISGLHVDSNFYPAPTGSGDIGYTLNYPMGQVVFDRSLSPRANVNMAYSYRWCQIHKSSTYPSWVELQELTTKPFTRTSPTNKGDYNISANHRVQMPCIIIEPIARSESKPWQLGSSNFAIDQDLLLHVFTENGVDNNKIVDIIRLQQEKTIQMYDINKVVNSGYYAFNYNGSLNNDAKSYDILATDSGVMWHKCFFKNISVLNMESTNKNLYWCTIRLTAQVII
jgi:hypothetical protein